MILKKAHKQATFNLEVGVAIFSGIYLVKVVVLDLVYFERFYKDINTIPLH